VVIGADGFGVFPIAVRLFSFTAELVDLLTLLIASREGVPSCPVGDRGAKHHARILGIEKQSCGQDQHA
jgi:hypothetical protein